MVITTKSFSDQIQAISPTCISYPVDFLLQEEGKVEHT